MSIGITSRVAVQRLNQHHRRHYRRPQLLSPEGSDQRHGSLRSRRETRQAAAVEHQHGSADPVERSIPNASCDCVRSGLLALTRLSDFGDQLVEVPVGLGECVLSLQLGPKCDLEKLGGWKVALLQLIVEVFGKIHLNVWHTPNYTPASQRISTSNAHMPTRSGSKPLWLSRGLFGGVWARWSRPLAWRVPGPLESSAAELVGRR